MKKKLMTLRRAALFRKRVFSKMNKTARMFLPSMKRKLTLNK